MKNISYKAGIITGLFLYAIGAALFWPAAEVMNYTLFLIGLFIIAAGLGCLETAANPCNRTGPGKRWSLPIKSRANF